MLVLLKKLTISIVKKVNNILMKKSVDLEQQCWANAQYSLRECLEIAGITTSILQQNLEENVCQIFKTERISRQE